MLENERDRKFEQLPWKLSHVVYATLGVVSATICLNRYTEHVMLSSFAADPARLAIVSIRVLMAEPLLYIASLLVALSFFRPVKALYNWDATVDISHGIRRSRKVFIGVVAGSIVSLICAPIPLGPRNTGIALIASEVSGAISSFIELPLSAVLIGGIAICTELFFRGVVLRTLARYSNIPSSIFACALIGAYVYPDHRAFVGFIVGVMSSILFYRTGSLTASIVASVVFTFTERLCAVAYHQFI